MAALNSEFDPRGVKVIGLGVDPFDSHEKWSQNIADATGTAPNYTMIGDSELNVAKLFDMLPEGVGDSSGGRTAADNQTVRNVIIVGPDKLIKAVLT